MDDLLVTGIPQCDVVNFFGELKTLSVKDVGPARNFMGMRIQYEEEKGTILIKRSEF